MDIATYLSTTSAAPVWHHFQSIACIPHLSGHEQPLRQHIINIADQNSLVWKMDDTGNLVVYKPATAGHENCATVVLQGHLDMVGEKAVNSQHNFLTDAITLQRDGDWLTATDTTLGADNGIGVAATLAILEDNQSAHGPLEALFTVEEETTMAGAEGLDSSLISGDVLFNLDTEEDQSLYLGCAGGVNVEVRHQCPMELAPKHCHWFQLQIAGLRGGHSGCDIHLQRGNAIQMMARVLKQLEPIGLRLSSFHGGTLDNAIPREAKSVFSIPVSDTENARRQIDQLTQLLQQEIHAVDPKLTISLTETGEQTHVFSLADQQVWLSALHSCHHGVKRYSDHFPGVVETSNNLGVFTMANSSISVDCFVRSLVDSATVELADNIGGLFRMTGASIAQVGLFPGWKPDPHSRILQHMTRMYEQLNGQKPEIKIIHAALECGILGAARPDMEIISFGPRIENPHTHEERINIDSVNKFWALLNVSLASIYT